MSKRAIGLLVVISAVIAFAITTFAVWLSANYAFGQLDYYFEGSDAYLSGNAELESSKVKNIELDWLSGNVELVSYDGDFIKIEELDEPSADKDQVQYHLSNNGYLQIKYFSSRQNAGIYRKVEDKTLIIYLPKSWIADDIQITVESGNIEIKGLSVSDKLYITAVNGNVSLENCTIGKLFADISTGIFSDDGSTINKVEVGAVTGNIDMVGRYISIYGGVDTGNVSLTPSGCDSIKIQVNSGNIDIDLAEDCGFNIRYLVETGKISFGDFQVASTGASNASYGDAHLQMIVTAKDGNISIK